MKMTIQKSYEFTVDTAKERRRIFDAFGDRPETLKKLMHLMDLIDAEKWEEAQKELDSKWWRGRDEDLECPRQEFIGLLDAEGIDPWTSYSDLIWRMHSRPEIYKVTKNIPI
jgi:hypothetical protein